MSGNDLAGARVLVMGIGRRAGGVGAIRYALDAGAQVRVTDRGDPELFAPVVEQFRGEPVQFVLGRHDGGPTSSSAIPTSAATRRRSGPPRSTGPGSRWR